MTVIEATGGSRSCHRCGPPLPEEGNEQARWGSFFLQGRLVLLACPDCLSERRWGLEELYVPYWVQRDAARLAREAGVSAG